MSALPYYEASAAIGTINVGTAGDLTLKFQCKSKDEVGKLTDGLNDTITTLREMIEGMKLTTTGLHKASAELTVAGENAASSSEVVRSALNEVFKAINEQTIHISDMAERFEEFSQSLDNINVKSHEVVGSSKRIKENADKGSEELKNLILSIKDIRVLFEKAEDRIEVLGNNIFIDGTKIEACANKYTFVWKKAVTKNMAKLLIKLADLVKESEELYGIKLIYKDKVEIKHVKKLRKKLYELKRSEGIEFVHGCGKRKTTLQKSIEKLEEYLSKFKEYNQKVYTCGDRNSYSKTDTDATFMRMKEDAMKNGQLKPAYNVQHGVDSEYITWLTVGPQPTDTTTLIPFLKTMEEHLNFKYLKIVADAGYESEENYSFIEDNNQIAFIKPANYELSKTRKYKNDIGKIENMDYNPENDIFICQNGKKLKMEGVKLRKSKTGYESEKTIYTCEDCSDCKYKSKCIKGNNCKTPLEERTKKFETSKKFNRQRKEALERIISDEGCLLRMNRSIQAEGSFAQVKQDMNFRRFMCRGQRNVLAESTLLAMAHNINKIHRKIQAGRTGQHLFEIKKTA